jgi:hypothetical protein
MVRRRLTATTTNNCRLMNPMVVELRALELSNVMMTMTMMMMNSMMNMMNMMMMTMMMMMVF